MPSAVIVEGILVVAGIVAASILAGGVISKVGLFGSAFTMSSENQKETLLTKIEVIYATNSTSSKVNIWTKNVGVHPITNLNSVDVYFGKIGSVQRIPYDKLPDKPTWNYSSSVDVWQRQQTLEMIIYNDSDLESGTTYSLQVTTPNGVDDEYIFSVP